MTWFTNYILPGAALATLGAQIWGQSQLGNLLDRLVSQANAATQANLAAQQAFNQMLQQQIWPAQLAYNEAIANWPSQVAEAHRTWVDELMAQARPIAEGLLAALEQQYPIPSPPERVAVPTVPADYREFAFGIPQMPQITFTVPAPPPVPAVPETYREFAFGVPSGVFFQQMPTEVLAALQRTVSAEAASRGLSGGAFAAALGEGMAPVYLQALSEEARARQGAAHVTQAYDQLRAQTEAQMAALQLQAQIAAQEAATRAFQAEAAARQGMAGVAAAYDQLAMLAEAQYQQAMRAYEQSLANRLQLQQQFSTFPLQLQAQAGPTPVVPPIQPMGLTQPAFVPASLPSIPSIGGVGDVAQALGFIWNMTKPTTTPTPSQTAAFQPNPSPFSTPTSSTIMFTQSPTQQLALAQQPGREWWRLGGMRPATAGWWGSEWVG